MHIDRPEDTRVGKKKPSYLQSVTEQKHLLQQSRQLGSQIEQRNKLNRLEASHFINSYHRI